jgi:glycosyltransferase involved in cell wall biosynthesis
VKILRVVTRLNVGGPSRQIQELINEIPSDSAEQILFIGNCSEGEKEYSLDNRQEIQIIKSKYLHRKVSLLEDIKTFFHLRNCIVRLAPDIIHTHMSKAWVLSVAACLTLRRPPILVHTFHGHTFHSYFKGIKGILNRRVQVFCATKTNLLIAVDEKIKIEVLREGVGNPASFITIEPGFKPPKSYSREFARNALGLEHDKFLIGYMGRLEPIKRTDLLLEIFSKLSVMSPETSFAVAGGGSLEAIVNKAEQDIPLKFLGWIKDVGMFYSAMDLMILTSDNEGTPLTVIEAGMLGIPTISRPVGGITNMIRDNETGFLVDGDVMDFTSSIQLILDSPDKMKTVSLNCKSYFVEKYQSVTFVSKHLDIYRKLLNMTR